MINVDNIWQDLQQIQASSPLIHNITNFVTMDIMANALLAIGASPIMAHSLEEIEEIIKLADGLSINIGTLEPIWVEAMRRAIALACENNIPIVIDPVGSGATRYRTKTVLELLKIRGVKVLRGNASEILSLVDKSVLTKGVDSSVDSMVAIEAAKYISQEFGVITIITGSIDYVVKDRDIVEINYGHPLMSKVTGMGCVLSSIVSAFLSVNNDYFLGSANAVTIFAIIGEIVASYSHGPMSFRNNFIDKLYNIQKLEIIKYEKP